MHRAVSQHVDQTNCNDIPAYLHSHLNDLIVPGPLHPDNLNMIVHHWVLNLDSLLLQFQPDLLQGDIMGAQLYGLLVQLGIGGAVHGGLLLILG